MDSGLAGGTVVELCYSQYTEHSAASTDASMCNARRRIIVVNSSHRASAAKLGDSIISVESLEANCYANPTKCVRKTRAGTRRHFCENECRDSYNFWKLNQENACPHVLGSSRIAISP